MFGSFKRGTDVYTSVTRVRVYVYNIYRYFYITGGEEGSFGRVTAVPALSLYQPSGFH